MRKESQMLGKSSSLSPVRNVDLESRVILPLLVVLFGHVVMGNLQKSTVKISFSRGMTEVFEVFTGTPGQRVMIISWQRL